MGWVKDPKKAAYNKVYKKTKFSIWDLFKQKNPPKLWTARADLNYKVV